MASLTIRNLDERTKSRLRVRAATHDRSMEEEARQILRTVLTEESVKSRDLASLIEARFKPLGGVELELPDREPIRQPPPPHSNR